MTPGPPDLQRLFEHPILDRSELSPGYDDHGSRVFRVTTSAETAIARTFALDDVAGPFWGNLRTLFGIDPRRASEVAAAYALLAEVSSIAVPAVLRTGVVDGREWVVVELMAGTALDAFASLDDRGLEHFGRALATIHARRFAALGAPSGSVRFELATFPARLARTLRALDDRPRDPRLAALAVEMCDKAERLAPPDAGALVMPDISPWQFLQRERRIVAMVDVDAYVVGPRELDLVFLEYFVDERAARLVARGYREVLDLPALDDVRPVYRFLGYVLNILPGIDLDAWMGWPGRF
jgi:hypothetical protein